MVLEGNTPTVDWRTRRGDGHSFLVKDDVRFRGLN
jgi:hypothetical protein